MTDEDNPFLSQPNLGATVIRPTPGQRRPSRPRQQEGQHPQQQSGGAQQGHEQTLPPAGTGAHEPLPGAMTDNPLVACATQLFTVAGQLRGSPSHPDPKGLLERLIGQVREFEQCARGKGLTDAKVLPARYMLCALLDESVLDTPWGSQSIWSSRGLLVSFHKETWGGKKFYSALEKLLTYPAGNLHLLELMYLCLAMGFEGQYRIRDGGRQQLEQIREHLYQTIRAQRQDPEPELSPHWRGVTALRDPLLHRLPLWVFAGLAGLLLLGVFAVYTFALSRSSDPVFLSLAALDQRLSPIPERSVEPIRRVAPEPPPPDAPAPPPTLRELLAPEIAANQLEVLDRPRGETVLLIGEAMFASASDRLQPPFEDLVRRVGDALRQLPGQVLITGHSDSAPIRTLRFPDNYTLSQARADSVLRLLVTETGQPERFTAEGLAATEPLISDNPRDARNRRVEIMLLNGTGGPSYRRTAR
ncbi:MAG: OmpA family protein [Gammaproteobacteria bacterium]|nr:OmpA family protein [Gammaproteobacteria bacterium]